MYVFHKCPSKPRFLSATRWAGIIAGAILMAAVGSGCGKKNEVHAGTHVDEAHPSPNVWQSDAALASSLAPEVNIGDYAIRPPKGFTMKPRSMTSRDITGQAYLFTGPKHPSGQSALMFVMAGSDGGRYSGHNTADMVVARYAKQFATTGKDARISETEFGTIGDMPYARMYWSNIGKETGKVFHGAVYAASQNPNVILIVLQDIEPYNKKGIAVQEASAMTLHKR